MKDYVGANILITGGLGFIGSHLAKRLVSEGATVTIVDSLLPQYGGNLFNIHTIKDIVNVTIKDVRDRVEIDHLLKDKDVLFNLAGQTSHLDSMLDPKTDLEINAAAQLSILESCRFINPEIKVVFASTRQIYGKPQYLPVDEQHPISPVDVNGINKLAGEWYHLLYNNVYGIRACALRLTNTYGPGMRIKDARQTFLGIWFKKLLEGGDISVFGDGLQLRDFNYVDDCVNALLLAGLSDDANGKVYNLGSDEVISLISLAEKMTTMGYGGKFQVIPFPADRKAIDIGDYYGNYSLIKSDLNWSPKVSLDEGLRLTADFYQKYMKHYL
jgi:dTDP-glucose 4,6-dehydratase/UDP-glucose 4-epimerase